MTLEPRHRRYLAWTAVSLLLGLVIRFWPESSSTPVVAATPADSVAAYAEWLKGMNGLDGVLAEADARMRVLGVVRKSGT